MNELEMKRKEKQEEDLEYRLYKGLNDIWERAYQEGYQRGLRHNVVDKSTALIKSFQYEWRE